MDVSKKSELEKKKAQLEELKNKKKHRNIQKVSTLSAKSIDIDKILNEIDQIPSFDNINNNNKPLSFITNDNNNNNNKQTNVFIKKSNDTNTINQKKKNLSLNQLKYLEIPPKEHIKYSKESQTLSTSSSTNNNSSEYSKNDGPFIYDTLSWEDEFNSNSLNHEINRNNTNELSLNENDLLLNLLSINQTKSTLLTNTQQTDITKIDILSLDKQKEILQNNDEFCKFVREKSTIIERALKQEDIYFDYSQFENNNELFGADTEPIKLNRELSEEKLKNRIVTSLDWSLNNEQLVASYENNQFEIEDGQALVWNLYSNTPEHRFNTSSWITSIFFNEFNSNLIIGGTYSGQICIWDTRSNKHTPIQRTPFSISSHTSPIYCLRMIGNSNANSLVSISNDGRMCMWNTCNMNQPMETIDLSIKQLNNIPIICFDKNAYGNFLVGTEDSYIYSLSNKNTIDSKYYLNDTLQGHHGPVCSLSANQNSNLFLSSSYDWCMKLWQTNGDSSSNDLIHSFDDSNEIIYDVKWSPLNPCLFACVDESGKLALWNLIHDTEVAIASTNVSNSGLIALNKLAWSKCGHQIATGDDNGKINVFNLSDCVARPKQDDAKKLPQVVKYLKENNDIFKETQMLY